jgi:transposase InsO family protein
MAGDLEFCENCTINKLNRLAFPPGGNRAQNKLHIVHSDICGPMKNPTHQGNRYFITFIDDYSRRARVYFIKNKSEALDKFQEFKAQAENETAERIKILRTDGGGEYVNKEFKKFLNQQGIRHQTTAPYTPQQNGVAERFNRTVVEMARTMLHGANLSYDFWAEAINTATYVRNRCISKALGTSKITPEEIWTGNKPDVSNL